MTSGSLWNFYRDEIDDVDDITSDGKHKAKIVGNTPKRPKQPGKEGDED